MQADYQHLGFDKGQELIKTYWVRSNAFGFHWHYHPEIEITCVKKGRGSRLVGDNISPFSSGDMVMVGSYLPHTWISDDDFNRSDEIMEVAVLQFQPDLLPGDIMGMPELQNVRKLFAHAGRGIDFSGHTDSSLSDLMFRLIDAEGFERFSLFLGLLDRLGKASGFIQLASRAYNMPRKTSTEHRLQRVCQYIHNHFTEPVKLNNIATIANLNASSFCRFFKRATGQSLSEYVNDLRIGKACNLLIANPDMSISEIGFKSGFNSQTLFNRTFRRLKGVTPKGFRDRAVAASAR